MPSLSWNVADVLCTQMLLFSLWPCLVVFLLTLASCKPITSAKVRTSLKSCEQSTYTLEARAASQLQPAQLWSERHTVCVQLRAGSGGMDPQSEIGMHQRGHLDEVILQPRDYVKKKTLQKYKIICGVSRHCSSGQPLLFFFSFQSCRNCFSNFQICRSFIGFLILM